ncbi:hypothetical protein ACFQYP_49545 [Nonomuraea antimicrobica]
MAPGAMSTPDVSETPVASETPAPPAIDDTPSMPSEPPSFGDLGDGREFGRVKVGYLPEGLQWSNWSVNYGDRYTTSWNFDGDKNGFYCVQIYVHEGDAVLEVDNSVQVYRDEGRAKV